MRSDPLQRIVSCIYDAAHVQLRCNPLWTVEMWNESGGRVGRWAERDAGEVEEAEAGARDGRVDGTVDLRARAAGHPARQIAISWPASTTKAKLGTLDDPLLHVFRAKAPGQIPEPGPFHDDGGVGLNAKLVFQPPVDGTYFISAEGFGAATGTYRLLVREQ
jgi:hypothetical protein